MICFNPVIVKKNSDHVPVGVLVDKQSSPTPVVSGYNLQINLSGTGNTFGWIINNELQSYVYNANCDSYGSIPGIVNIIPSVQTIRFIGEVGGGYTTGTIYINGVGQEIQANTTYTLQNNNDYVNITLAQCLKEGTIITLINGVTKRIERLKVGDKVVSINPETGKLDEDTIIECDSNLEKTHTEYDRWTFENCYYIETVHRHRFFNIERKEFVYMDEWNIGEHTYSQEGKQIALISHENIKEEVKHYTLFTEKWNNYFANGLLSGNRNSINLV